MFGSLTYLLHIGSVSSRSTRPVSETKAYYYPEVHVEANNHLKVDACNYLTVEIYYYQEAILSRSIGLPFSGASAHLL